MLFFNSILFQDVLDHHFQDGEHEADGSDQLQGGEVLDQNGRNQADLITHTEAENLVPGEVSIATENSSHSDLDTLFEVWIWSVVALSLPA